MVLRLVISFAVFTFSLYAKPLTVQVSAPSAILINADTGAVLYSKNVHEKRFPASTTKIATALYVLEKKGERLDEIAQASKEALYSVPCYVRLAKESKHPPYRIEHDGTSIRLKPGETISLASLLYGLMLSSGNDAGNVLAEATSGSIGRFCDELNFFLKQKGILETHFVNPHGQYVDDHWTTAHDLAQITRLAMKHPMFREIVKAERYLNPQTNLQPARHFVQHNRLLKQGPYYYPKAIGVKTGYHSHGGFNLVAASTHEGRTLIAVVLKCPENVNRYRDTIKLFEAAFAEKKMARTLFARESDVFSHHVKKASDELKAVLKDDAILEYYPAEEPQFRAEIKWTLKDLPLNAGDCVGHLRCIDGNGNVLLEKPIFAMSSITQTVWAKVTGFCMLHKTLCLALFLGSQVIVLLIYYFKKHQKIRQR